MAEWHTHYPVQSGAYRGQLVTTHPEGRGAVDAAVRCEMCGTVMAVAGAAGDDAARQTAESILNEHGPMCPGPGDDA